MAARRPPSRAKRSAPKTGTWTLASRSAAETERFGRRLGEALRGGEVLALYGELGAGKTLLVRGLASGLQATADQVSSPTFVLINEYAGRLRLAHADLYRLDEPTAVEHLGLWDYADGRSVLAIEWAEKAGATLPSDRLDIRMTHKSPRARQLALSATGPIAQRLLTRARNRSPHPSRRQARSRR